MESPSEFYHKIEVMYLLSQGTEQSDHPHMIQVQYPSHQQSPTLRDVKSRLTALRGRGMPDSYAWSYKRSYKGTFIWCDVFDDDVILPLGGSDEYVLKALEVFDASHDVSGRELDLPCKEAVQPMTTNQPLLHVSGPTVTTSKEVITQSDRVHGIGNVGTTASHSCSEAKVKSIGDSVNPIFPTKVLVNEHTDACSTGTSVSEDSIENKRCFERFRGGDSSTSMSGTNSSTGTQTEPCALSDDNSVVSSIEGKVKAFPSVPFMQSIDNDETSTRAFPTSEVFRKGSVKSRTWVVKEEDVSAPVNVGTSRRCSDDFCDKGSMLGTSRDIPPSPLSRPCFPGHPWMFMLKKAARFHRSQLCRRVEVVETFRSLPLEDTSFSRCTSKGRHVKGPKKVAQKPHFSKIVTLQAKPQRRKVWSEGPEKESRSLSEFLETAKSRSFSEIILNEGAREIGSARHIRSDSKEAAGSTRCREVTVGSKGGILPDRVLGEDEKFLSDLKSLVSPELKSFKMVTKSAVRQASNSGIEPSSSLFNPVVARGLQHPIVSRPREITKEETPKQHRSLVAGFTDLLTRDGSASVGENAALKPQNLKALKVRRPESTYFSRPLLGTEKKSSDTRVYPTRESFVFGSTALHIDSKQEVKTVNPKHDVLGAPLTKTGCTESVSILPKNSPPNLRGFKATKDVERPLTSGLMELHWESLQQEALVPSHPPEDLVLHECLRCGRTFKPESLKVHLRGCHVKNESKQLALSRRRVSL